MSLYVIISLENRKEVAMFNFRRKSFKKFDFTLFFTVIILCIFGQIVLGSATLNSISGPDIMRSQILSTILGFIAIFLLVFVDYDLLGKLYIPIYIVSVALLFFALISGVGDGQVGVGARRWLVIGGFVFQPSEPAKLGLIISLAKFIDINKDTINAPFSLLKIIAFSFLPVLLIFLQPDVGTAFVFVFFIAAMLFAAGIKWKYIGYAFTVGLLSLPLLWLSLDQIRRNRLLDFLQPERDPTGTGYQALQGKIAIGSGQLFGRGLYQGTQTQYNYLPAKQTDYIFAVLAEELGFLGGVALIFLYFVMLERFITIAKKSEDLFGSLVVIGIFANFLFHIWENIGMTIGLMPITGIPLPFFSHGGTYQLINLISVGIVLSVGLRKREGLHFEDN